MDKKHSDGGERANGQDTCPAVTGSTPTVDNACCKIERVAKAYGLMGINDEFKRRREQDDATLHELAKYFNERLTAVALGAADIALDAEPGTVYAAIQDSDEIDVGQRDEILGVVAGHLNIDRLRTDYTSHETIRKHLNDHLDISTSRGTLESAEEFEEALRTYEQQYKTAVMNALQKASEQEFISGGDFRVFSTRVECRSCSATYRLEELLASGGCDCQE